MLIPNYLQFLMLSTTAHTDTVTLQSALMIGRLYCEGFDYKKNNLWAVEVGHFAELEETEHTAGYRDTVQQTSYMWLLWFSCVILHKQDKTI